MSDEGHATGGLPVRRDRERSEKNRACDEKLNHSATRARPRRRDAATENRSVRLSALIEPANAPGLDQGTGRLPVRDDHERGERERTHEKQLGHFRT
jgi:hypothetical protein